MANPINEADAARMIIGTLSNRPNLLDAVDDLVLDNARLRATVTSKAALIAELVNQALRDQSEMERLRAELAEARDYIAKHECGAESEIKRLQRIETAAHAWANAVEESDDDGEESEQYVDAAHTLYVALGRPKPAQQSEAAREAMEGE